MARFPITVVINASAGSADKEPVRQQLTDIFRAAGGAVDIVLAPTGAAVVEAARSAVDAKHGAVVAAGGDGTINAVASALVGTQTALGVLPLGTLNHFAKDMQIPLDAEAAARVVLGGRVARVDVGEVNGRIFLNNSGLGLYPSIVRGREERQRRGYGKWVAFLWAALATLRRYPFLGVSLNADGRTVAYRTPFVFIGNNEYEIEGLRIGARPCLDAGVLSICVARRTGRLGLILLAARALVGRLRQARDFDTFCAKEVLIEARRRAIAVSTDGEVTRMAPPLRYRLRPAALSVIVPDGAAVPGAAP